MRLFTNLIGQLPLKNFTHTRIPNKANTYETIFLLSLQASLMLELTPSANLLLLATYIMLL
ncbi:hypothetical protein SAMN06265367_101182 [Algoriphagus winogradskyi]|uniref:Uncharacterized protein n=1 Tax=Algoriphagus winogradskyi TaxID=237017 RepID=A0ABY1N916_9BACT|nr:hypothetical protein SAMN06265367_101182 [Algoriphagus winogradskyi]